MERWFRWRAPHGLLILLVSVVALPAATLVILGVRLLQQDLDLASQRRAEMLQDASARAVRALDDDLEALKRNLSDPSWRPATPAPGSIHIEATPDDVRVHPSSALAFFPVVPKMREPPAEPFRGLDTAELMAEDLPKALVISRTLASSSDPSTQAGALLREARILRKMNRSSEALLTYGKLAAFTTLSINGLPADLQARKTICALLQAQSRAGELRREAAALDVDLAAGRWQLDRSSYEYVSSLLDQWLGTGRRPDKQREANSAAAEWLLSRWTTQRSAASGPEARGGFTSNGAQFFERNGTPVTVVWGTAEDHLAAVVGGPEYLRSEWLLKAQRAAGHAWISLVAADARALSAASTPGTLTTHRSAADTGLPWTVVVSLGSEADSTQFEARRRTLLAALAAVLVLVATGSYLIVRSRNREMALARLQSDFVATVSHEFRTPLTTLRQYNELLDDPGDLTPEKRRTYHQAQTRATERLHRLVESLLDFGRMEDGKRPYAFERLDAGLLVRDVVEEFQMDVDGHGVSLRSSIEPIEIPVHADAEALARALWNVLDNAVKYSGEDRDIDVAVVRVSNYVSIAVRDRGIGIPPAEQSRIFQKFARGAAASSRHIKGTGIGLAMVQHIVSAHRGTVQVTSVEHEGSTFRILLPIADRTAVQTDAPPVPASSARARAGRLVGVWSHQQGKK